ncbi:MAG: hypothetical protein LUD47_07900 [Clostridia bacterium]|nr:hypothetical protein [Clostridia bacterium]
MDELNSQGKEIYHQGAWTILKRLYEGGFLCVNPQTSIKVKPGKLTGRQAEKLYYKALFDELLSSRKAMDAFLNETGELVPRYYTDENGHLKCIISIR